MKNIVVVTGGAGFVGSNLIDLLIDKTQYNILSILLVVKKIILKIKE